MSKTLQILISLALALVLSWAALVVFLVRARPKQSLLAGRATALWRAARLPSSPSEAPT